MVRRTFAAAHFLPGYDGKCRNLHGHNWTVDVFFKSLFLDQNGIAIDFKEIKNKLDEILEKLDHTNLNELDYFKKWPPSCENISYYIYMILEKHNWNQAWLNFVRVWESENSYAEYSECDN